MCAGGMRETFAVNEVCHMAGDGVVVIFMEGKYLNDYYTEAD